MVVYVLYGSYDSGTIDFVAGIYSTRAKAEAALKTTSDHFQPYIEVVPLDVSL